jgi:hypothetical protein
MILERDAFRVKFLEPRIGGILIGKNYFGALQIDLSTSTRRRQPLATRQSR